MIQIIEGNDGTHEGLLKYAWIDHAKSIETAVDEFKERFGYPPKGVPFKMFPGVVCGPLDLDADYGGHG
jgi:hypothetical protein